MSAWALLLPELYTIITRLLPIRARINLKRACRRNYRWERERLWLPRAYIKNENYDPLNEWLACPYRNATATTRYQLYCTVMRDLFRIGWLDLLWQDRFAAANHPSPVVIVSACLMQAVPQELVFAIIWCNDCPRDCPRPFLELRYSHTEQMWSTLREADPASDLSVVGKGSLTAAVGALGLADLKQYFSPALLFPSALTDDGTM